jgi:uncharacterized FlaG/YvyC family protein
MPEDKMSIEQVPKISSVDVERQVVNASIVIQQQAAPIKQPDQQAKPVEQKNEDKKAESQKHTAALSGDISLRFLVDDDTHAITILVVDRASQKVIRSIPPEEMGKFQGGNLFDYFA